MLLDSKPYTLDRVVRIGIIAGLVFAGVWTLGYLAEVLIPFTVALLIAYLMNPLVCLIQKKIRNRLAAVLISLFLIALLLIGATWLVTFLIMREAVHMREMLVDLANDPIVRQRAANLLPPELWQAVQDFANRAEFAEFLQSDNFQQLAAAAAKKILPNTWALLSGTLSFIFIAGLGVCTVGLYLVFLLLDFQRIREGWQEMIPVQFRDKVVSFVTDLNGAMSRYFRAQAAVASIVGILFAVGFGLIGLPLGVLLGLFVGLLNMVPYLQILGLVPAFFLALLHSLETGNNVWLVLAETGAVFIIVQTIQDTILVPKIMGKVTGLSPAIILLSLAIWGKLLGMLGLLIALPMTCLLLAYYKTFLKTHAAETETDVGVEKLK